MIFLGIDPGKTTGMCAVENGKPTAWTQIDFGKLEPTLECWIEDSDAVAIEKYIITPRTASMSRQYEALYVIGIVLYFGAKFDIPVRLESAANAKNAYPNEFLKELGLYDIVVGTHVRDALRHALLYERTFYH